MMMSDQVEVGADASAFLARRHGLFINGEIVEASSRDELAVFDPSSGMQIAAVASANAADVDRAILAARRAFEDGRWSGLAPAVRERVLLRLADLIERDGELLAQIETMEQGKSIAISRAIEVGGGVDYLRYAAGLSTKITGMTLDVSLPSAPGTRVTAFTRREPVGVVVGIVPWNFPLAIAIWKIAPALAAGCTIVLKPSELTPLTALRLAELATEAGVPDGVLNVLTGLGPTCGHALVSSPLVNKISFTGSTATGKSIARAAVDNMTRLSLELGGKNPALVLKDADIVAAVDGLMLGAFFNQGQVCASASRVYVEAPLYDEFVARMEAAVTSLQVGPGLDPAAQVNPLVSRGHLDKVTSFLDEARSQSANLIVGRSGPDGDGYYVAPALVLNPASSLRLCREEVFGPLLGITRVTDAAEGLALANDSRMGLAASVWTRDLKSTFDMIPQLQAGTVWVNGHVPIDPNMPFGGYKESGLGRDFGPRWLDSYTEEKAVCITH